MFCFFYFFLSPFFFVLFYIMFCFYSFFVFCFLLNNVGVFLVFWFFCAAFFSVFFYLFCLVLFCFYFFYWGVNFFIILQQICQQFR